MSEYETDSYTCSFDLLPIHRPDNTIKNVSNPFNEEIFETDLTIINLDAGGGGSGNGEAEGGSGSGKAGGGTGSGEAVVVRAVTETRQYRGKWRFVDGEVDGTLIQSYQIGMAHLPQLKHQWEMVDDRFD